MMAAPVEGGTDSGFSGIPCFRKDVGPIIMTVDCVDYDILFDVDGSHIPFSGDIGDRRVTMVSVPCC